MDCMKLENTRWLRNELLSRHQIRLHELRSTEERKLAALEKLTQNINLDSEVIRLKTLMINASHDLDCALNCLFELSYGLASGQSAQALNTKLSEINHMIHEGSRKLSIGNAPDQVLSQPAPMVSSHGGNPGPCSQISPSQDHMEKILSDIRSYEFWCVCVV